MYCIWQTHIIFFCWGGGNHVLKLSLAIMNNNHLWQTCIMSLANIYYHCFLGVFFGNHVLKLSLAIMNYNHHWQTCIKSLANMYYTVFWQTQIKIAFGKHCLWQTCIKNCLWQNTYLNCFWQTCIKIVLGKHIKIVY